MLISAIKYRTASDPRRQRRQVHRSKVSLVASDGCGKQGVTHTMVNRSVATCELLQGLWHAGLLYDKIPCFMTRCSKQNFKCVRPTRITEFTATLIDNIYTNSNQTMDSCILIEDISDHLPIILFIENDYSTCKLH